MRKGEGEKIDDGIFDCADQRIAGPNVIILSNSGKPIFSRYGDEVDVSNTCAMLHAMLSSSENNQIQSFKAGTLLFVVSSIDNMSLLAISNNGGETEIFLRMLLEYVYAQIVFTLTDQIHNIILSRKTSDLISILGPPATRHLYTVLEQANENPGPLITAATPVIYPLDYQLREHASKVLQNVGYETDGLLFAALIVGDKLVTLVQPKYRYHQLNVNDVHLILSFVQSQPCLNENESWLPICLPIFHSDGYIYTFTSCLHKDTGLTLMLMSTNESQEQFNTFRKAATRIKQQLYNEKESSGLDIKILFQPINTNKSDESIGIIPGLLIKGITQAILPEIEEATFQKYCTIASCYHFLFRLDTPLPCTPLPKTKNEKKSNKNGSKVFSQCISPPLSFPFVDSKSKQRVWNTYQRLSLRLKLGASSIDASMHAYNTISSSGNNVDAQYMGTTEMEDMGIKSSCPAIQIIEPKPPKQGITYILDGNELFFALNGNDFVLMAVFPATIDIRIAAASCAKLVRQLMREDRNLFIEKPLTWRQ